jgi:hypothetical protein
MLIQGQVGPLSAGQSLQPGSNPTVRLGQQGDLIVSEAHGRFYEQTYRGGTFRFGTNVIVTGAATMATATAINPTLSTSASGVPMLGIWNPPTSSVNVVMLQAQVNPMFNTATTPTPFGSLIWGTSLGNGGIQLGQLPFNSKTLAQTGSQVKAFNGWQTLAGLTNPITTLEPADLNGGGMVAYGTASQTVGSSTVSVQNFDGQLIVPPGAVLGLFANVSTTSFSYTGRLLWEEVPL